MTDLRKAAEMALDALRLYVTMYPQMDKGYMVEARETLRQALAQPEQTPVSHLWECIGRWSSYLALNGEKANLALPEWLVDAVKAATAQPDPTPRQLQRIRQRAWQGIKQDEYKFDPEVCFAMGFDAGYGAVASKVEPSQGECGGFDSRPAPLKEWVGLTKDEITKVMQRWRNGYIDIKDAEQLLKEKNT